MVLYRTHQPRSCNTYLSNECWVRFSNSLAAAKPSGKFNSSIIINRKICGFVLPVYIVPEFVRSLGASKDRGVRSERDGGSVEEKPKIVKLSDSVLHPFWRSSHVRMFGCVVAEAWLRSIVSRIVVRFLEAVDYNTTPSCQIFVHI